ncbi:ABC transporter ATP-binding protein [Hymenobacter sp. GOD-10R]|uniref:ABC transporter ATP-binding protein n=1 Tax=Hymenobacter sp. GOD-10R TaxID=3093922 RepID=UPI002D766BF0|nr:ABC transporter ATP-binding protein [Hymenobacter sp. GOD-10R]WRQ30384.1 ABC transporter ATP-binding protein [Hymenobacter sp. GOD-10R]
MSLLSVTGISLQENNKFALKDISFTLEKFQKLAIAGETGAGKSTLLQITAGLLQSETGEVRFEDKIVRGPADKLVPGHPAIAYLSQQFELPQFLRVEQVLRYANKLTAEQARTLYDVCRINHLITRKTNQLSGGERQRIALAKLLLASPTLLLLDEPFSNLDRVHKNILKSVIHDLGEKLGITCILISHDPHDTLSWADEIMVLKAGQLIQRGTPAQIYRQPVDEYTTSLFGDYNLITGEAVPVFAELAGIEITSEALVIRPEDFKISSEDNGGLLGEVTQARFFGAYSELEIKLAGTSITAKTGAHDYVPGAAVYVTLAPESGWFL